MNNSAPANPRGGSSVEQTASPLRPVYILGLAILLSSSLYVVNIGDFFFHDSAQVIERNLDIRISGRLFDEWRTAAMATDTGPLGRPLSMLSFAANYALAGSADPQSIKFTNVLIHALAGCFLYLLIARILFASPVLGISSELASLIAAVSAAIWLLHPLQVSTVMYSVQRMTQLAALFTFAGLWHLFRIRTRWLERAPNAEELSKTILALCVWTTLATLSKENGILLPLFAAVVELTLFRGCVAGGRSSWLVGLAAAGLVLAVFLLTVAPLLAADFFAWAYATRDFTLIERLLTQGRMLWHYLGWTFLPNITAMGFNHDDIATSQSLLTPSTTLVSVAGFAVAGWLSWHFRRRWPLLGFATLWFLVGHMLESTVLPLEMSYEHRNYLPMVGPLVLLTGSALLATGDRSGPARLCLSIFVLALLPLLFLRASAWTSELGLTETHYRHHPASPKSAFQLASTYYDTALLQADPQRAQQYFAASRIAALKALDLQDDYVPALAWLVLMDSRSSDTSRVEEWQLRLQAAVSKPVLSFSDRRSVVAVNQCVRQGLCPEPPGGQEAFLRGLTATRPGLYHLRVELALFCLSVDQLDCAADEIEAVLLENPESKPALQALYDIQRGSGRVGDAQETARRLMMVDPDRRFTRRLLLGAGS